MKNGQKMKLTKIAAVTLSAALIFGCDDLEFKETTSSNDDTDSGSETDTGTDTDVGQYAILTNIEAGSSGQMRYDVAEAEGVELTDGQIDVNVFYSSSETETAYISLFNADTNTSGLVGEVQLDDGNIKIRSGESTTVGTFTTGTWVNVNVTWSVTAGTYTVTVDGTEIGTYDFHNAEATGVDTVGFKIGTNALESSEEFLVDDLTIYSDEAGTTEVFFDDYEDYVVDELLDGAGDPYNDETQPAIVGGEASDDTDETDTSSVTDDFESYTVGDSISDASTDWSTANIDNGSVAEVSETQANGGTQSLYLADLDDSKPYAYRSFSSTGTSGSVSVDVYTPSTNTKTTYINVGTGKNNADRYFEVRLSSSLGYENSTDGDVTLDTSFAKDAWHTVTIAWTEADLVTISLDGTEVATDIDQTTLSLSSDTPTQFTVYTGDSDSTVNSAYFDNVDSDLF